MPLQSQVIPICVTQNSCFFGIFWEKMLSHGQTVHFLPIVLYIFRKLCIWGFRKSGWNSIFDILWSVRFLVTGMDWIRPSFLHCVLRRVIRNILPKQKKEIATIFQKCVPAYSLLALTPIFYLAHLLPHSPHILQACPLHNPCNTPCMCTLSVCPILQTSSFFVWKYERNTSTSSTKIRAKYGESMSKIGQIYEQN